jgi:hypothetical protein
LIVARGDLREARAAGALPIAGLSSLRVVATLLAVGRHELSRPAIGAQAKRPPSAAAGRAFSNGNSAAGSGVPGA